MKLTDANLEKHTLPVGQYGFSATKIADLGATEYTLVNVVGDRSGSTQSFRTDMEQAIASVVQSCKFSERADNLLVRLTTFHTKTAADDPKEEIHGFKLLSKCNIDDYKGCMPTGGYTALYDATENAISACISYGRQLVKEEFSVNGIVFVITDGDDRGPNGPGSTLKAKDVKKVLAEAVSTETLESLMVILIGVNVTDPNMSKRLQEFRDEAGITQYVELKDATPKTLAKLAEFISKSISSQSKALGTGAPSQPLQPPVI